MGRFTAALVSGIESGDADKERKGKILLSDLRRYLDQAVKGQTPTFFARHASGDPLISLSPATGRRAPPVDNMLREARAMVLAGRAPPDEWCPFILRLDFESAQVTDLSPLKGLTALQSLVLRSTQVSDLSPLKGLTALQTLDLLGTQVNDLSPLAGLTALQSLDLAFAQVTDLSPLAGLTALQSLDLDFIQVNDLSPLKGLTALQSLGLNHTRVSDLSPLKGLTALQIDLLGEQRAKRRISR